MTAEVLPPIRKARTLHCSGGTWSYDTWGTTGRPVLFIHSLLFTRTMWWPVAAELHRHCTPVAVDLPGHGQSPARVTYDPVDLVDELAALLYAQTTPHAPVVVGHGTSAGVANLLAQRFATRAIVLVDPHIDAPASQPASVTSVASGIPIEGLLTEMDPAQIPSYLQDFATPSHDAALLQAYGRCVDLDPWNGVASDAPMAAMNRSTTRLAVYSRTPDPDPRQALRTVNGNWRYAVYGTASRFPHLTDVDRFAADIRSQL
ncbi:alpha/beta fold hydrolase [Actinoplanes sp. ATCC 53533]|uniref:alpha/beta fold hydrolase n=1 Tax=Actinoplanes sp. ATCC 53533 TaxID=1288362 RepID=UPI00131510A8|nr:alpha/beta hydrolase [Actinoplanes sp. ATCC 53533]